MGRETHSRVWRIKPMVPVIPDCAQVTAEMGRIQGGTHLEKNSVLHRFAVATAPAGGDGRLFLVLGSVLANAVWAAILGATPEFGASGAKSFER